MSAVNRRHPGVSVHIRNGSGRLKLIGTVACREDSNGRVRRSEGENDGCERGQITGLMLDVSYHL